MLNQTTFDLLTSQNPSFFRGGASFDPVNTPRLLSVGAIGSDMSIVFMCNAMGENSKTPKRFFWSVYTLDWYTIGKCIACDNADTPEDCLEAAKKFLTPRF